MKKVLLGTSAVALASAFATSASAAEWEMKVGGYMEQHVAYASSDVSTVANLDQDGVDVKQDAEIHFKPSITLDNGIKIGVDIQLEGNTSGDTIDESFLFINGSFGQVLLGNENSAGYKMTYGAPDVTFMNVNSGSLPNYIPFSGAVGGVNTGDDIYRGTLGSTFLENARNNDAARITYFSPRFAGFQLGVSYARDAGDDSNAQVDCNAATCDFFDVGANYVNSFGGFDVAISGRYGIASGAGANDPTVFGAGLNLGVAGVTIGGSFAEQNDAGNRDGQVYDVGVSYKTGPWGFSFTYMNGSNVDDENAAAGADEELQQFLLGVTYSLAKGVKIGAFGAYVDFDEDLSDGGGGTGDDVDGFVIGTGIKVNF